MTRRGRWRRAPFLEEVLERDPAGALHVGVALLEADEAAAQLVQPELCLGLQHTGPLPLWDEEGKDPGKRRLPSTGWAAQDHVEPGSHRGLQQP